MRRKLKFDQLDEVLDECELLLASGYTKSGNWSLAQICRHLRVTIEKNMDGYPAWMTILGYPLRPLLRRFGLPRLLAGDSPSGMPTAGIFVPPTGCIDEQEVEELKQVVTKFCVSQGRMHAHPGFGKMSNEQFNQFHAAHAAHHMSFLHPKKYEG